MSAVLLVFFAPDTHPMPTTPVRPTDPYAPYNTYNIDSCKGLASAPHYNGRGGECLGALDTGRLRVLLWSTDTEPEKELSLKPDNLELIPSSYAQNTNGYGEAKASLAEQFRFTLGHISAPQGPAEEAHNQRVHAAVQERLEPIFDHIQANPRIFQTGEDVNVLLRQKMTNPASNLNTRNIDLKRDQLLEELKPHVTALRYEQIQVSVLKQFADHLEDVKSEALRQAARPESRPEYYQNRKGGGKKGRRKHS